MKEKFQLAPAWRPLFSPSGMSHSWRNLMSGCRGDADRKFVAKWARDHWSRASGFRSGPLCFEIAPQLLPVTADGMIDGGAIQMRLKCTLRPRDPRACKVLPICSLAFEQPPSLSINC
jgi:hypothetical protein